MSIRKLNTGRKTIHFNGTHGIPVYLPYAVFFPPMKQISLFRFFIISIDSKRQRCARNLQSTPRIHQPIDLFALSSSYHVLSNSLVSFHVSISFRYLEFDPTCRRFEQSFNPIPTYAILAFVQFSQTPVKLQNMPDSNARNNLRVYDLDVSCIYRVFVRVEIRFSNPCIDSRVYINRA